MVFEDLRKFARAITRRVHRNCENAEGILLSISYDARTWSTRSHYLVRQGDLFKLSAVRRNSNFYFKVGYLDHEERLFEISAIKSFQFWVVKNNQVEGISYEYITDDAGEFKGTHHRIYPERKDTPYFHTNLNEANTTNQFDRNS